MNRRGFIGRLLTFIPLFGLQRLFGASCLIPSSPIQSDQDNVLRIVKNIRTEIDCDVRMVQHIKGTISFRRLTSYVEKCKSLFLHTQPPRGFLRDWTWRSEGMGVESNSWEFETRHVEWNDQKSETPHPI